LTIDVLIKNGNIVDGSGNPWFKGNVALKDGKILKVGKIKKSNFMNAIDASGQIVCPGFIDMHSHSDWSIYVNPKTESAVRQGVTLEVIGNCGSSAAPLKGEAINKAEKTAKDYQVDLAWSSMAEYIDTVQNQGISLNVVTLIGQGTVRSSIMGYENREPTKQEFQDMKDLIAQSVIEGGFGLSTGLIYPPGCYAKIDELVELCKVVAKYGGIYSYHVRSQNAGMYDAVNEAIEIGERANLPIHISHEIPAPPIWGQEEKLLNISQIAREKGIDVTGDILVYLRGQTGLKHLIPDWAHSGGDEKLLERIRDPNIRKKIKVETIEKGAEVGGSAKRALIQLGRWDKIWLANAKINDALNGKSFDEIAKLRGVEDPFDAVFDILIEENANGSILGEDKLQVDIDYALNHPLTMIGSDGSSLATYGALSKGHTNPRSFGTFSKILASYVRERKVIPLELAISKMTSFPAQRLGLQNRGLIRPGMYADLVIFDFKKVKDNATYENPYQYPEGMSYVYVNGRLVIENDQHTGNLPGIFLKKNVN
jgi:N-acyl-D-amino-acid deacylase